MRALWVILGDLRGLLEPLVCVCVCFGVGCLLSAYYVPRDRRFTVLYETDRNICDIAEVSRCESQSVRLHVHVSGAVCIMASAAAPTGPAMQVAATELARTDLGLGWWVWLLQSECEAIGKRPCCLNRGASPSGNPMCACGAEPSRVFPC
jgi:hypothetical protein